MLLSVLYCTVLHCTALHCTALHCTALHCTALHCTALYSTLRYCTLLWPTQLYRTLLRPTQLYCTALYSMALYRAWLKKEILGASWLLSFKIWLLAQFFWLPKIFGPLGRKLLLEISTVHRLLLSLHLSLISITLPRFLCFALFHYFHWPVIKKYLLQLQEENVIVLIRSFLCSLATACRYYIPCACVWSENFNL